MASGGGDSPTRSPLLIVRPTGGLANRLRVISSFRVLAGYSNRRFQLSWVPGPGWSSEDIGDLFENTFPRGDENLFGQRGEESVHLSDGFSPSQPEGGPKESPGVLRRIFDVASVPVVTYQGCLPWPALFERAHLRAHLATYDEDYARVAREWVPQRSIRQTIDRITTDFTSRTVGVHIRRGDAMTTYRSDLYRQSTDRAFMGLMDRELERDPRTSFFLATDCEGTENRFRARYPDAVVVNGKKRFVASLPGMPKDNQRDAVVDMFALARTCKVIGNRYSSFSKLAAVIGGISWQAALESNDAPSSTGAVSIEPTPGT